MYKSQLQVLCQKRGLALPVYDSEKEGPDHCPRFTATVTVNGRLFHSPPDECRSAKEAHNSAAKVAFDFLSGVPSNSGLTVLPTSPPSPSLPRASSTIVGLGQIKEVSQQNNGTIVGLGQTKEASQQNNGGSIQRNEKINVKPRELLHVYKNRLLQYAQKHNLSHPVYVSEPEGPPHSRQFKASVSIDGSTYYQCSKCYPTLKDAEHAAAKMALESLSNVEIEENDGLFKTLLRDLALKRGYQFPTYSTNKSGQPHIPIFVSTVDVDGVTYHGEECKTKRQSETSAAKVAFEKLNEVAPEDLGSSIASPRDTSRKIVDENRQKIIIAGGGADCSSLVATGTDGKEFQHPSTSILGSPDTLQNNNPKPAENRQNLGVKMTPKDNLKRIAGGVVGCSSFVATGTDGKEFQHPSTPILGSGVIPDTLQKNNPKPVETIELQEGKTEASSTIVTIRPTKEVPQQKGFIQSNEKAEAIPKELLHLYKNRLQQYVQKKNLSHPAYASEFDGPPHCRRFKASVTIDGRTYQCSEYYPTLKDAEHAAAKVALESLSTVGTEESDGLFKTLLQELAQKKGYQFPKYSTNKSGLPHTPNFVSAVEVGGVTYQGEDCKSKKQSEMSAAKVAYEKLLGMCITSPQDTSRKRVDESCQNVGAKMTPKVHIKRTAGGVEGCSSPILTGTDDTLQNNSPEPAEENGHQIGKAEVKSVEARIAGGSEDNDSKVLIIHQVEAPKDGHVLHDTEVESVEARIAGDNEDSDSKVLIFHHGSCIEAPNDGPVLHDTGGWMAMKVNPEQEV